MNLFVAALVASTGILGGEEIEVSPQTAREALGRATSFMRSISVEGSYVWRVAPDFSERWGEGAATATQAWVQAPGTPAMGMAFLRAHAATGDAMYLAAARAAAEALARGQLESGGWDYRLEFDPTLRNEYRYRLDPGTGEGGRRRNTSTFDDDNTQGALRFLLAFADVAKGSPDPRDARIREALDYGLRRMLDAQYPIGAWPQRWNGDPHDPAKYPVRPASYPDEYPREQPETGYYDRYTFNDNTHRDCVRTLLEAHRRIGRAEYLEAAKRGVDFLLLAQMPEPQPAWAQQYDAAIHPAWARAFEPPSVTVGESVGIVRMLVDMHLEFGDARYLEAAGRAVQWFRRSEIAPGRWARLYELQTNKPIYGDRDGRIHYTLAEISEERRTGYGWEGGFGAQSAIEYYERVAAAGREAWRAAHAERPQTDKQRTSRLARIGPMVAEAIRSLDEQGRWISRRRVRNSENETWLESGTFIRNVDLLCEYLELSAPDPADEHAAESD